MRKYFIPSVFCLISCSTDSNCPEGTIIKLGECQEVHNNQETGDFEDDPPQEPDPYNNTPGFLCSFEQELHPYDVEVVKDIYGDLITSTMQIEFCPTNPAHHSGDPWPAKPYSPYIPNLPNVTYFWGPGEGDENKRSGQIANFGIYLGLTPTNHPRAPLYSPLFWQLGATEAERARYNVIGAPCTPGWHDNISDDLGYYHGDCVESLKEWGTQPEWPNFPITPGFDEEDLQSISETETICLSNQSYAYSFQPQAIFAVQSPDLRGLTWMNAAFADEFFTSLLLGTVLNELKALGAYWELEGDYVSDVFDQMLAWMDGILGLAYLPNCDPNDANDDLSPSVHCAAWSKTGMCSFGIEVKYQEDPEGWYTFIGCPIPFVGVLPPMDLSIETNDVGEILPGQTLSYEGWCQPSHTMWSPGGAATPPPGGELLDIIQLPLNETGFYRGYLINTDVVNLDTLLTWQSQINLVSSPKGLVIKLNREFEGGRELLSKFGLKEGDIVTSVGYKDLRNKDEIEFMKIVNTFMNEGKVINAYILRGSTMLPTYVMRASYRK